MSTVSCSQSIDPHPPGRLACWWVGCRVVSGAFNSLADSCLFTYLTAMSASTAFFTKAKPLFYELLWGYVTYSRYRDGQEMKNKLSFIKNPKADEYERMRDARTVTLGYEHIAGLAKQLRKDGVAVEQLPAVAGGNTFVSPTTGVTWCDVLWDGYVIPAELVSQLVDEANKAITERAANLSQGNTGLHPSNATA